jgi:flagellar biosynthesis/type III secretory pathway protein FliH
MIEKELRDLVMKHMVEVVDEAIEEEGAYLLQALAELILMLSVEL